MLALTAMSNGWMAVLYVIAVVIFLLGAFRASILPNINLVALGLAVFVFVYAWQALAAT